jgi:transcriptional/translational regulatory protein YebC/TACO1
MIFEVVTDNRNRTVAELRHALTEAGGSMAEAGSVSWQFRRAAYFVLSGAEVDPERAFELAVEAGAEDVIFDDDIEIIAPVEAFKQVSDALEAEGIDAEVSELRMMPNNVVELGEEEALRVMRLIEKLEDLDDVQNVFSNLEVTEQAVAMLESA